MAYYENNGQINDEAISISGGRTFQVIQLADSDGNIIDPAQGSVVFDGEVTISSEVEIKNDAGSPVPASVSSLPLPSGAATAAKQDTLISAVDGVEGLLSTIDADTGSIDGKLPALSGGKVPTEPLGIPAVARQLSAGASSANTALTSTCRRISIKAIGADIRYAIGSTSQTASATTHFIGNGERLDLAVPATPNIAVIRNGSTSGTLELTELS